jgi:uncharacterized membrane protein YfcA
MMEGWTVLCVLLVIFVATVVRSAFGFGEALIAVPLLALVIPARVAVPLATLLSVTVAAVVLAQDWHQVHARSAWRLILSALCGIPLGLWLLAAVEEHLVKAILAVVILTFAAYCLARRTRLALQGDRLAWVFGFASGVLGGAYGMNGPPLVIYGALRHWSAAEFRATLQGYFLPASLAGLCGYWYAGLWVSAVSHLYLLSLPVALAAVFLGRAINRRLHGRGFIRYVYFALIAVGTVLLLQSLLEWAGVIQPGSTRHGSR